jgi:hypothetical protein
MSEPHPQPEPEAQPPSPPPAAVPVRAAAPALLYVLGAFGVVLGGWGSLDSLTIGFSLLTPRDTYVEKYKAARVQPIESLSQQPSLKSLLPPKADVERFGEREAEARLGRRNAALPLALVGVILSCLLFAGCTRTMLGDPWGLGAWSLAALASVPYQVISTVLTLVTVHDTARGLAAQGLQTLPPFLALQLTLQQGVSLVWLGVALSYYGACIVYLRRPTVRARFSADAGRTPPSA